MQWTLRDVHLLMLMQLRTRVLDGTLDGDFQRWRKQRQTPSGEMALAA